MVRTAPSSGFTIIEVMLFLAITGLMITGMFIGVSGSINRQRYNDSVRSLQDYLQGQYNFADNVRNNRGEPITGCGAATTTRGTSDCTVVGRLITTTNGLDFTSVPVFSTNPAPDTTGSEKDLLDDLDLTVAPADKLTDEDDYQVAWSSKIYTKKGDESATTAQLLIVRMPTSGVIRTYFRTTSTLTTPESLKEMWATASEPELILCVAPDGLIGSTPTGVRVLANAINANSVQFITAGAATC